jgi:RimJ/RimL family protein N-acetyltransferase
MNMDDYEALYAVLADTSIMQHYPYTFDEERVKAWIERNMNRYKDNGFGLWAVCLKETGEDTVELAVMGVLKECHR